MWNSGSKCADSVINKSQTQIAFGEVNPWDIDRPPEVRSLEGNPGGPYGQLQGRWGRVPVLHAYMRVHAPCMCTGARGPTRALAMGRGARPWPPARPRSPDTHEHRSRHPRRAWPPTGTVNSRTPLPAPYALAFRTCARVWTEALQ